MRNNELITKKVYNNIVDTNETVIAESKLHSTTIYGAMVNVLEEHTSEINEVAEKIGAYFALNKGIKITQEYEKNCSLYEKYIKNNDLKLKQMESERTFKVEMYNSLIQTAVKGGVYIGKRVLKHFDKQQINNYVFGICVKYANLIGLSDASRSHMPVQGLLDGMGRDLYGKPVVDYNQILQKFDNIGYLDLTSNQAEIIAKLLYMIYAQKHLSHVSEAESESDMEKLCGVWASLGIWGNNARFMFDKFEKLNGINAFEYNRTNMIMQGIYDNLVIQLPRLDTKKVRAVNRELLQYVPNGDKQLMIRNAGKKVRDLSSIAAVGMYGFCTENPAILASAATGALNMFSNIDDNLEVVGNCLEDSGLKSQNVAKCIDAAKMKQKQDNTVLVTQKDD